MYFRALVFNDKPHYSNRNKNIYRVGFSDGFAIQPAWVTYDEIPQSLFSHTHIDGNPHSRKQLHTFLFQSVCRLLLQRWKSCIHKPLTALPAVTEPQVIAWMHPSDFLLVTSF